MSKEKSAPVVPYPGKQKLRPMILKVLRHERNEKIKSSMAVPQIDIDQNEDEYKIHIALPGIKRENLCVRITKEGNLSILLLNDGAPVERNNEIEVFSKEITLPDNVDTNFASATCREGSLFMIFKKGERSYPAREYTVAVY